MNFADAGDGAVGLSDGEQLFDEPPLGEELVLLGRRATSFRTPQDNALRTLAGERLLRPLRNEIALDLRRETECKRQNLRLNVFAKAIVVLDRPDLALLRHAEVEDLHDHEEVASEAREFRADNEVVLLDVQINYGIKTGCNEAFIINESTRMEILANCKDAAERKRTEQLIRPILRGRDIKRYSYEWANLYLIATFPALHLDINDYFAVRDYLLAFGKERLKQTGKTHIFAEAILQ